MMEYYQLVRKEEKNILVTGPNSNNHSVLDWVWAQPEDKVTTIYEGISKLGKRKATMLIFTIQTKI